MNLIRHKDACTYEPEAGWLRKELCPDRSVSVEHFVKPPRHSSPLHSHTEIQVLVVLQGKLAAHDGQNSPVELDAGDAVCFASGEPHCVINLLEVPSVGLDIFVPGRPFDFWSTREKSDAIK